MPKNNIAIAIKIEAILYLKGKPLLLSEIAEYARCDYPKGEEGKQYSVAVIMP
jgi:segregation and condensation protein B